jgi:hypothetical protein
MAPDPKNPDASQPNYRLRLPVADLSFRLTDAERATVQPQFDVDALERLLGMMQPSERQYVLSTFQMQTGDSRTGGLTHIGDPELQRALARVWRPVWDKMPLEALMSDPSITHFPGVREARVSRSQAESPKPED